LHDVPGVPLCWIEAAAMQVSDEILTVLWLGAGAVALWMFLPAVLDALGLTYRYGHVENDAAAIEPSGDDDEYEALFGELRGLGFEPVGRRSNTCWFFLHHWYRNFQARIFVEHVRTPSGALRQGESMATTYKLRAWDPWRLCFVTAFSDGAILITANQMERLRIDEPKYMRWGLATPDRALLLERHREACRDFAAGGRQAAVLSAHEVNNLILHHEARNHRKQYRWNGLKSRRAYLGWLAVWLALVYPFTETAPALLPLSIIGWGLVVPFVHAHLFRVVSASFRAEDERRQRTDPRRVG
jgi:hypothetical protein